MGIMLEKATKGTVFVGKLRKNGTSLVITLPETVRDYLGVEQGDDIAIVCEHSPKHGNYAGIGKYKKKEAE